MESSNTPRPTPSIPSGGLFSCYAEAPINASALAVYKAILDTSEWPAWNTFVPQVTITHQPTGGKDSALLIKGSAMTFQAKMTSTFTAASKEVVTVVDKAPTGNDAPGTITRVCWEADHKGLALPSFMMHADRVNEIEHRTDGTCTYRTWETFSGPIAKIVRWKYGQTLQERFDDWVRDLKAHVEGEPEVPGISAEQ